MKKTFFKAFFWCFALLPLVSCSQDEPLETNLPETKKPVSHKLTVDEAINRSYGYILDVATPETRAVSREISSVECITSKLATRGGAQDTLLYLVNYADNAGFLLMSTDDRLYPVYAFSDTGNLNLNDTTFNVPLRNYMAGVTADIANVMDSADFPGIGIGGGDGGLINGKDIIQPKLTPYQSYMHQSAPFNAECPLVNGQRPVAGCVPVACEMALSYFKSPVTYKNDVYHWDEMNVGENDADIAKILARLGDKDNLQTNYGVSSSGSVTLERYEQTFKNFGFPNMAHTNFTSKFAAGRLTREPIVVRGSGHAWVIDGLYKHEYKTADSTETMYLFHCVWGWGGSSNGYYRVDGDYRIQGEPPYYWEYDPQTGGPMNWTVTEIIYGFLTFMVIN